MKPESLVIANATVVDPSQGLHSEMHVVVENGVIADISRSMPETAGRRVVDAKGLHLAAGFVDLRTHLREPGGEGSETIESGTRAAAAGGFTTIHAMANTSPVCDSTTGVQYVLSRAADTGCVNVVPVAAVTRGQEGREMVNFGVLRRAGVGAFSDSVHPVRNADMMRRALEYTRMVGVPIMEHCQDLDLAGEGVMHEGEVSLRLGLRGIPRIAESVVVARDVALAAATGGHVHISHVSTRESVKAIREAKLDGVRVTAETTPHHLTMTDADVEGYNTLAKVKPPLCGEADRLALLEGLEDGTIDCIATDHAPHPAAEKNKVFDAAPFGIIGLESCFPLLYTRFVESGRWDLDFLIERLTVKPAEVVGGRWGTLRTGQPADMVLIQTGVSYEFERRHLRSKCSNCPWLGETFGARIAATFVNGSAVFVNEEAFPKGLAAARKEAR